MLVTLNEVMAIAKEKKIAIGSFNTPNSASLFAVLDAAEKLDLPVIIAHAQCHEYCAPLDRIGPLMVEAAKRSRAKVCVHLDHGEDIDYCKRAIALGFTSVMIDLSVLPYEENVKGTKEMTDYAHKYGVSVEAELGAMPSREGGSAENNGATPDLYTKPEQVPDFVGRTNVDALAIAFGTAHGIYKTTPILNLDVITEVTKKTDLPLVMHGGSGVSDDDYRRVIARGVRKINYYTYMAFEGYAEAKRVVEKVEKDNYHELALSAQHAMEAKVEHTMRVFAGLDA